jgi:restriction endonuclease
MQSIDLTEIPRASHGGSQGKVQGEAFEHFARAFLSALGLEAVEGPDRGPDDGRDLIVVEVLTGGITSAKRRWLVSVKHYAHDGRAVGVDDEINVVDRVAHFRADGLIAFYSTLPSSGLARRFRELEQRFPVLIYDAGRIAELLHGDPRLAQVFKSYLPKSFRLSRDLVPLRITTEIGSSFPLDQRIELDLQKLLTLNASGFLVFSSEDLEDMTAACVLVDALRRSRFDCLKGFVSFRPAVWEPMEKLIREGGLNGEDLASEITKTQDTAYLRLLIRLAGLARALPACRPICDAILSSGRYHRNAVAHWPVPATPFLDVARKALSELPAAATPILQEYLLRAKAKKAWLEKQTFEWALRQRGTME